MSQNGIRQPKGQDQSHHQNSSTIIVTYAVPKDRSTISRHKPLRALTENEQARRVAFIDKTGKHWGRDPDKWFRREHRPDRMPEDPKDWSTTYLFQLGRLAENTDGDVGLAQQCLGSAAQYCRGSINGKLAGHEIKYALDKRLKDIGPEKEQHGPRTRKRKRREVDEDSEHEMSRSRKEPANSAGFNPHLPVTKRSQAEHQDGADTTREATEEIQEQRIRQTSSAFPSLRELADSLPRTSKNTTLLSFGAALSTIPFRKATIGKLKSPFKSRMV